MIKYFFISPGLQVKVENDKVFFPSDNRIGFYKKGEVFLCDVGNYLGDGIIDHHTLDKENECATTLIFNEYKNLLDDVINYNVKEYTIITHLDPDFDAIGCTYFVSKKLKGEPISPNFKTIANYILDVDLGKTHLDPNNILTPFSLILAINYLISKNYENIINSLPTENKYNAIQEKNEKILLRSFELIDYLLSKIELGYKLYSNKLFDNAPQFKNEIELIKNDYDKYVNDHLKSEKYKVRLLNKKNNELQEVDALFTANPESVLWKYWARGDRINSEKGYILTCAFLNTYKNINKNRAIIAIDRTSDYTLKGLGLALDELEMKKIISNYEIKNQDELLNILHANKFEKRNRYHRGDPWFDERNEFTIIDSPRSGSFLTNDEIISIVLSSDYWQMLSKKCVDINNNFYDEIILLFPEIIQKKEQEQFILNNFFDKFKSGIYDDNLLQDGLETIKTYLLSTNNSLIEKGIENINQSLLVLSKFERINLLRSKQIDGIQLYIHNIIKEALNKSGDCNDHNLQNKLLNLIYLFYSKIILKEILPSFRIVSPEIFYNFFRKSIFTTHFPDILNYSIKFLEKNDIKFFNNLKNYISKIDNKDLTIKQVLIIIDILIIFKKQSRINYSNYSLPISSFDDVKDTIDDYIYFSSEGKDKEIVTEFISKDSSFFLNSNIELKDFEIFLKNYNTIRDTFILDDNFWSVFLNEKNQLEESHIKDNSINILKKFTKSFILECSLQEFFSFRNCIINIVNKYIDQTIFSSILHKVDLIYTIKIFEDLLERIKIIVNLTHFKQVLIKETIGYSLDKENINSISPITEFLNKFLRLILVSQFIPDINKYRYETRDITYEFISILSNFNPIEYSNELKEFYNSLKNLFELMNLKNSLPMNDYEQKLTILDSLLSTINSEGLNLFNKANKCLQEPERSLAKEILFSLNTQFSAEKVFLNSKLRNNLKNEDKISRNALKIVLKNILLEATKDELRRFKQVIDDQSNDNVKTIFYNSIIKPFRILSYYVLIETRNEYTKSFNTFIKIIRNSILKEDFSEKVLQKTIKTLKKKVNCIFENENEILLKGIITIQNSPIEATILPECINIQTYEFLINHFLDKYSIEDAREKIEEFTNSRISKVFKFFTSWWISIILILLITMSFLITEFKNNFIIYNVNGIILFLITFLPILALALLIPYMGLKLINKKFLGNIKNNKKSVYGHLISYSQSRINNLSFKLLLIEFIVPLALGILASVQDPGLLYGLLKISDFRLIAILPIIMTLSYFSLYNNIATKNNNFTSLDIHKVTLKIYSILFFQAWFITVSLLNIICRYIFIDQDTFDIAWTQILSVGEKINFLGFDFLIFPKGTITITFISLFIGLFLESFNKKVNK